MKNFVAIAFLVTFLFTCRFTNNSPTESKDDKSKVNKLMPLAIGNSWAYIEYSSLSPEKTREFKLTVSDTFTLNNVLHYQLCFDSVNYSDWIMYQNDTGLFILDADFNHSNYFKYPVEDGEIYNYTCPLSDSTFRFEATVHEPLGDSNSFPTYGYYNHNLHSFFPYIVFIPNAGMIRHKMIYHPNIVRNDTSNIIIWDLKPTSIPLF